MAAEGAKLHNKAAATAEEIRTLGLNLQNLTSGLFCRDKYLKGLKYWFVNLVA